MKINESNLDRIIRAVAGIILIFLGVGGTLVGVTAIVAEILGAILLLTGAIGFCPIYAVLKIRTNK